MCIFWGAVLNTRNVSSFTLAQNYCCATISNFRSYTLEKVPNEGLFVVFNRSYLSSFSFYLGYPYVRELVRHEFEKNRHMTDMVKARQLLLEIEEAIYNELYDHEEETACKC